MKTFSKILLGAAFAAALPAMAGNVVEKSASAPLRPTGALSGVSAERTVLAQKQLAPGVLKRAVRDAKGRVFFDMVRNGHVSAAPLSVKIPAKAAGETSFFENFESHQGQLDWLPEGWTEINTPENVATQEMCQHNINNTWAVSNTGDGYWTAITSDGVKECWIHFTYDWSYNDADGNTVEGEAAPQDEWLITPEISVQQGHDLFFLAEVDLGGVYSFDWGTMAYDRSVIDCDLEVLVTEDNGANWTPIWKLSDNVCSSMTDQDMYDVMAELKYFSYSTSLASYYGKNIKIAFRYINANHGFSGNSMAVDAVTVGAPAAEAAYDVPLGTLLGGISTGLHVNTETFALMPPYTDITWTPASNSFTEQNTWTFYDVDGEVAETLTGDAVVNYPWSQGKAVAWPSLTASNASTSDSFVYDETNEEKGGIFFGGRIPDIAEDEPIYVGNYDYQHKHMVTPYLDYGAYVYGTSPANAWGENIKQTAFGNLFYTPAAPVTVSDVMLTLGEYDADPDALFTLSIYTVNDSGQLSAEPVATSQLTGADITGFGFYNAIFHLDTPYVLDQTVLIMVSGFDSDKVREFAACAQSVNNDPSRNYAYMMFDINGQAALYSASEALTDYSSAVILSLNATSHFLTTEDEIVELDPESLSYDMEFTASNTPDLWWVVDGEEKNPITSDGILYDWLRIEPVAGEANTHSLHFSAEPTTNSRAKNVILANGGSSVKVRVKQPASSGIASVASDKSVNISADMISVKGNGLIEVFDAAGVRVAAGRAAVSISGLAKGVYVIRTEGRAIRFVR